MIPRLIILLPLLFVYSSCNRGDEGAKRASKSDRVIAKRIAAAPGSMPAVDAAKPGARATERHIEELTERIYEVPDDELHVVFESIRSEADPERKGELYAAMFDETLLRPGFIRLPLILEMARQPELHPSLSNTIMAELGTTLATDHGKSWADWALAIDEHLAATEGLLRVE